MAKQDWCGVLSGAPILQQQLLSKPCILVCSVERVNKRPWWSEYIYSGWSSE